MHIALELANAPTVDDALVARLGGTNDLSLDALLETREALVELLAATAEGRPLPPVAVDFANRLSAAAPSYAQLDNGEVGYVLLASPPDAFLADLARDAIELVGGPQSGRPRRCDAPSCGRFFVASRPRQIWCSDTCGNRARVARSRAA